MGNRGEDNWRRLALENIHRVLRWLIPQQTILQHIDFSEHSFLEAPKRIEVVHFILRLLGISCEKTYTISPVSTPVFDSFLSKKIQWDFWVLMLLMLARNSVSDQNNLGAFSSGESLVSIPKWNEFNWVRWMTNLPDTAEYSSKSTTSDRSHHRRVRWRRETQNGSRISKVSSM